MSGAAAGVLLDALSRLAGTRVLVVGDVIADRYHFGEPTRISREAPVLILESSGEATIPGGAANAAANVRGLGGEVELAGVVGDDAEADLLRGQLEALGVGPGGLVAEPGRPTTTKTRIFAGSRSRGQQVVRLDRHSLTAPRPETVAALLARLDAQLDAAAALLVSDYGYGALDADLIEKVMARAQARRRPVVVDSQGDLSRFHGAGVVTPNLAELEAWAGHRLLDPAAVTEAARELLRRVPAQAAVCTRGGEGMSVITPEDAWHLPVARRTEVFDVAGAGDTVAATVALALGAGLELRLAALLADCAASVVVQKLGAATCSPDELRAAIEGMDAAAAAAVGL